MRTRYAVAIYLVIFGSIIVAAYKMGMVHERPLVVQRRSFDGSDVAAGAGESDAVLEIRDEAPANRQGAPSPSVSSTLKPTV